MVVPIRSKMEALEILQPFIKWVDGRIYLNEWAVWCLVNGVLAEVDETLKTLGVDAPKAAAITRRVSQQFTIRCDRGTPADFADAVEQLREHLYAAQAAKERN